MNQTAGIIDQLTKHHEIIVSTVVSNVTIVIYPSKDPVITVATIPKMDLIEFIVFILSCPSFWFGLCPLQLADIKVKRKTRVEDLTRKSNHDQRGWSVRDNMVFR